MAEDRFGAPDNNPIFWQIALRIFSVNLLTIIAYDKISRGRNASAGRAFSATEPYSAKLAWEKSKPHGSRDLRPIAVRLA
jgi:hypothetical protein